MKTVIVVKSVELSSFEKTKEELLKLDWKELETEIQIDLTEDKDDYTYVTVFGR